MRRQTGFTLIELMIVVAIIAIIAAIALPNLIAARLNANETAAIASLRSISSAQAQLQASAKVDVDNDGTGEFGLFRELSASGALRTAADGSSATGARLQPPVLSGTFRLLNGDGEVTRSGYHFKVFVPNALGRAVSEVSLTALEASGPAVIDTDLAETTWAAYAWPGDQGNTGNRTFFVGHTGDLTASERAGDVRSGPNGIEVSEGGFAFVRGGNQASLTGLVAVGTIGRDNMMWKQVN